MVENSQGEYLLQRRSGTGFLDGYFDVSGSGHLEYGESLEACGVRELYEETHLLTKESDLELVATFQTGFEAGVKYLNAIYRVSKYSGELVNGEPTKIDKLAWYRPAEFPDKLTIGTRIFLQALKEGEIRNFYIGPAEYKRLMGEDFEEG